MLKKTKDYTALALTGDKIKQLKAEGYTLDEIIILIEELGKEKNRQKNKKSVK